MPLRATLRSVPLFADLPEDDIERLAADATITTLHPGEALFEEGDQGESAYVISDGEVEVLKTTGPRQVLLALRGAGDVIGEMALLDAAPRMATVRAKTEVSLLTISKQSLDRLLDSSPEAVRALFGGLLARWRETEAHLRQTERMAQLGTLTAGLAHELNNPAAAIQASARFLSDAVERHATAVGGVLARGIEATAESPLQRLLESFRTSRPRLSALERLDREDEVQRRLNDAGVAGAAELAPRVAATGLSPDELEAVLTEFDEDAAAVIEAGVAAAEVSSLLREITEGSGRLSAIVGALKSYSHLDQSPLARFDLHSGIDDTLLLLGHKLSGIEVHLDYAAGELAVIADPGELNQVWTNLIDNAADALASTDEPQITIRTAVHDGSALVEVTDNGPGIPADIKPRIFDAFFTTKPPGSGTGLGLEISYGIIVHRHGGTIEVDSAPGATTFRVSIPMAAE